MDTGQEAAMAWAYNEDGHREENKTDHFEMYKSPQQGDMLMDTPATDSWRELWTYACDREYWKARVRALRQPRITTVTFGPHHEAGMTVPFTVST